MKVEKGAMQDQREAEEEFAIFMNQKLVKEVSLGKANEIMIDAVWRVELQANQVSNQLNHIEIRDFFPARRAEQIPVRNVSRCHGVTHCGGGPASRGTPLPAWFTASCGVYPKHRAAM